MVSEYAQNAVRFYGYVQWCNAVGLVMEYFPIGNLSSVLLNSDVILGALLRYRICCEIAEGLFQIHNFSQLSNSRNKIVHGDIKPENVLVTNDLHCKIADFGSSQIFVATGYTQYTLFQQTQPSKDFTAVYAPPELLQNTALNKTPATDVYSYSMIIYLVLKRNYPFGPLTRTVYLEGVKNNQVPEPACDDKLMEECEVENVAEKAINILKTIFLQCQAIDPADRPKMEEVTNTLKDQHLLSEHQGRIKDQVDIALGNISVGKPLQKNYACQTLDKFLPPSFQSITSRGKLIILLEAYGIWYNVKLSTYLYLLQL